jgi:periplasmic protein TonB
MSIQESIRYGAAELKRFYNRNLGIALGVSVGFHLLLIFLYIFSTNIGKSSGEKTSAPIAKMKLSNLAPPPEENVPPPPPPPMVPPQLQMSGSGTGGVASRAGNPVPVPDALIAPDVKEFSTTTEISMATAEGGDGTGFGGLDGDGLGNVPINTPVENVQKDVIPDPEEFIPVEEEPKWDDADLKKRIKYPEMARKNGIEGKVTVQVYVDKTGRPVKTRIPQSDNKILEAAAIEAIMETSFSPAIMNQTPVGVWVTIPVNFSLNN